MKHGTFHLGEGKNSFYFSVHKKSDIKTGWKETLTTLHDKAQNGNMFDALSTGSYVELVNKSPDRTVDFTIRTHMTNDKNAQLILNIEDPRAAKAPTAEKRELVTAMGWGALITVITSLSNMALRHIPTETQTVVVTIQNDFSDAR